MDRQLEKKRALIMEQIKYNTCPEKKNYFESAMKEIQNNLLAKKEEKSKFGLKLNEYNSRYLMRGWQYTACREGLGFAIYFNAYNYFTNMFNKNSENHFSFGKSAGIGAASAFFAWIPIYPIDRMKTFSQSDNSSSVIAFKDEFKKISGPTNKIKFIYKGYHYAMMRALPFHATCFVILDFAKYYKCN